jgi:hypothetical protein
MWWAGQCRCPPRAAGTRRVGSEEVTDRSSDLALVVECLAASRQARLVANAYDVLHAAPATGCLGPSWGRESSPESVAPGTDIGATRVVRSAGVSACPGGGLGNQLPEVAETPERLLIAQRELQPSQVCVVVRLVLESVVGDQVVRDAPAIASDDFAAL